MTTKFVIFEAAFFFHKNFFVRYVNFGIYLAKSKNANSKQGK